MRVSGAARERAREIGDHRPPAHALSWSPSCHDPRLPAERKGLDPLVQRSPAATGARAATTPAAARRRASADPRTRRARARGPRRRPRRRAVLSGRWPGRSGSRRAAAAADGSRDAPARPSGAGGRGGGRRSRRRRPRPPRRTRALTARCASRSPPTPTHSVRCENTPAPRSASSYGSIARGHARRGPPSGPGPHRRAGRRRTPTVRCHVSRADQRTADDRPGRSTRAPRRARGPGGRARARAARPPRRASPLRPRARVEADRRRRRQVERLGAAADRHAHDRVGQRAVLVAQPPRLVAEQPGRRRARGRARRPARRRRRRAGRRGRARPAPSAARTSQARGAQRGRSSSRRSAPVTTGRWNSDPAVDRTTFGLCTSTLSRGQHAPRRRPAASAARMTVPAFPGSRTFARTATSRGGRRGLVQRVRRRAPRPRRPAARPGSSRRAPRPCPTCTRMPAVLRAVDDLRVPLRRLGGDVHVVHVGRRTAPPRAPTAAPRRRTARRRCAHGPPGQRPHGLDPLGAGVGQDLVGHGDIMPGDDEAPASPRTPGAPGAPSRRPAPRRGGLGRSGSAANEGHAAFGALTSSGRAALAAATSVLNVAASLTARSASTRRSTSMPASLRPWMRRL